MFTVVPRARPGRAGIWGTFKASLDSARPSASKDQQCDL